MSFPRLPLKGRDLPIRPSISLERTHAAFPFALDDCRVPSGFQLTDDGTGFPAMLNVVLPLFSLGTAAVALGLCRAAVAETTSHLKSAKFEHLGKSLAESLPT